MDLFEHQAKELFAQYGVPVPTGRVATSPQEARAVAEDLGGSVVVKAQVKTGGRGKAGGIKVAAGPGEAEAAAAQIIGMDIKGHVVHKVLVESASEISQEFYVSYLLDRANRSYLAMASAEGGMEIETLAVERPEALARVPVAPGSAVDADRARGIVDAARLPAAAADGAVDLLVRLWDVFDAGDATLVEVNPLVLTAHGRVVALDGKVTLDNNAVFRHPDYAQYVDRTADDPLEQQAKEKDLNYVKLDGSVGIIGNGAGLMMSTLDVVAYAGEEFGGVRPANFLDVGGGATAQAMADGLTLILSDPNVKSVFVNIFGGIMQCDTVANGIRTAYQMLEQQDHAVDRPLVLRLDGNRAAEGHRILDEANLPHLHRVDTMDGAARLAAELAVRA